MPHDEGSFVRVLREHCSRYPGMQLRDMVKLIYQNEHGCGHLIQDAEKSLTRLREEYGSLTPAASPAGLFEEIGGGLCRLHLGALREGDVSLETVNGFAVHTARTVTGSREGLIRKLRVFQASCEGGLLPFDSGEAAVFLREYEAAGCFIPGHSPRYRELYSPAYRVVRREFMVYYPLFCRLDALLRRKERVTAAVDGGSSSGKSTLAELIRGVYGCNVFHMDDFFLPPALRTPERLAETGGNVDYARFHDEVLRGLAGGQPFSYRVYDCSTGTMGATVQVKPRRLNLVEGVYSLHPLLRDFYDLRVFLRIGREEQRERVLVRNGPKMLERFVNEWIPMEDRYFKAMNIRELCDLVFEEN